MDPVRERPRVLVGRQAPLHVLRPQRDDDAVPRQVTATGPGRAGAAGPTVPQLPLRGGGQHPRHALPQGAVPRDRRQRLGLPGLLRGQGQPDPRAATVTGPRRGDPPAARPGVTELQRAAQNVNLLRWARYYGIDVAWSILWGFPGETAEDYAGQAAAASHLVHLQPPGNSGRIWLERFSPLYTEPERFGLVRREPARSYRYVYPEQVDLDRIAYFFDYE